jgi:predicted phage-related endonuclease
MSITEMNSKVQEYREIQSMIDELTAEAEAIKDQLKAQMIAQGSEELTGTGWKATWHTVTSSRFDSKLFKEEHPELYRSYSKEQTVCRFCLA